jgi:voltage-gated potassium channel
MMQRKVLIFGFGDVGSEIQRSLNMSNDQITIVENNPQRIAEAISRGCKAFNTDLTIDENLRKIGVGDDITDIFCVTSDNELNLFVTLTARSIDKSVKILSRAEDIHQKSKLLLAGANKTIDMNEIAANKLFGMLKRPFALDALEGMIYKENSFFAKNELELAEIEIPRGAFLDGQYMAQICLKENYDLLMLGILDKEMGDHFVFNVSRFNHKIDAGDIIVVIGTLGDIEKFKKVLHGQ